jgi:hypothetical protein
MRRLTCRQLDVESVRSSIARRLGVDVGALPPVDRHVEGVVEMVLDATANRDAPVSRERLFGYPFDDGNGRIARAIGDVPLARADGSPQRFYRLSAQIQRERNAYYDSLGLNDLPE